MNRPWARKNEKDRLRGRAGMARAYRVKVKANWTCAECGTLTTELQADHIIPLAEGGKDDEKQMQALCVPCHDRKSEKERRRGLRAGSALPPFEIGPDGFPL